VNPAQDSSENRQQRRTNAAEGLPDTNRHMASSSPSVHLQPHPQAKKVTLFRSSGLPMRRAAMATAYATIRTRLTWARVPPGGWAYRRMPYTMEERDRRKRKEILSTFI